MTILLLLLYHGDKSEYQYRKKLCTYRPRQVRYSCKKYFLIQLKRIQTYKIKIQLLYYIVLNINVNTQH